MSIRKSLCFVVATLLASIGATGASAQTDSAARTSKVQAPSTAAPDGGVPRYIKPETPEQRRDRLGTEEDPGPNPDSSKEYWRYGKKYTIERFDKEFAKYLPQVGWVRPLANVNAIREIYQENDKYIWVWSEVIERPEASADEGKYRDYSSEDLQYFDKLRDEFSPLTPPPSSVRVRFTESSDGLPSTGSWRNGAAVADMNGDGHVDLILPPQRGAAAVPSIFLGDGKGKWTAWKTTFPRNFNYGSVAVADFNKDKKMDIAAGIHLTGVAVFLGDGNGRFREAKGSPKAEAYPTRRVLATDIDADGWTDVVAITEGPMGAQQTGRNEHGNLRAYLNRDRGENWQGKDLAMRNEYVAGDYLASGNFNGDRFPDFIGSSVYFNSTNTLYLSTGSAEYDPWLKGLVIPGRSYYHATAAGRLLRSSKTDDAVVTYSRQWPGNVDPKLVPVPPATKISGIDRITFTGGEPTRVPLARWTGTRGVAGVATGDFDGDGRADVAYVADQTLSILLGDGLGNFSTAEVEGIAFPPRRTYDLKVADFNGDRRPDVLVMFESGETTAFAEKNGRVQVFLNGGAMKAVADRK